MEATATCYTLINEDALEVVQVNPSVGDLRNALQKGSDDVKLDAMRRIIVGTLNGTSYVSWLGGSQGRRAVLCRSGENGCGGMRNVLS